MNETERVGPAHADLIIDDVDWAISLDPERRIIRNASIVIRDDRIVAFDKAVNIDAAAWDVDDRIDGSGLLAIPGFVETHLHNAQYLARGLADETDLVAHITQRNWPYEHTLSEEDVYWASLASQLEMLKAGSTCFVDTGNHFPDETIAAMTTSGVRGVMTRNSGDRAKSDLGAVPGRFQESTEAVLRLGEEFVARHNGAQHGRVRAWYTVRNFSWATDELIEGVAALARRDGVGIVAHALASIEQRRTAVAANGESEVTRLERLNVLGPNWTLVHLGWLRPNELELLRQHDVKVSLCPASSFHQGMGSISHGKIPELLALGVTVGLGSDSSASGNFIDMTRQMFLAAGGLKEARLDAGIMSPETVLEMATILGARCAQWDDEIGSIEVGKKADLTLFNLHAAEWHPMINPVSNLVYSAHGGSVDTVLVDGRVLMKRREVVGVDEEQVWAEADARSRDVARRANLADFARPRWPVF